MFSVRVMNQADFGFATRLTNTMDWNMAKEDFQFMTSLEPEGCFVAFHGRERVGIATTISFGEVGWFGNLIVKEKYRKMGAGNLLVNRSINYLQVKGVRTVGLYAEPSLHSFYNKLGFKVDEDFTVLKAESLGSSTTSEALPKVEAQQVKAVEKFDSQYFGGNRYKLLESIILEKGNLSYFKPEANEIEGYVAATVCEKMAWVGPLICKEGKVKVATSLLKAALSNLAGKTVYTVLPKKEAGLVDMLFRVGFREDFSVSRMFLGEAIAKNCIYMAESLERG
jgi:GNAT superfamily N-acetyltransferase